MINYDDKRNFYRMLVNSEVLITVIDDEANQQINATCRDLSATGMAVEIEHPIEIGTMVKMKIDSSSASVQSFDAQGKVVRVVEETPENYLVGINITDVQ